MAGCYNDAQDLKADLNIEVAREGDILEAGQDLKDRKCDKNPGHRGFIPFKDLTLEHLPNEIRSEELFDKIKSRGSLVVRLVVDKQILGTGSVVRHNNDYFIQTNNHVVGTDKDVKNCIVQFHYDDKDESGVITRRGVELASTEPVRDTTVFTFHPVPDFVHQLDWMAENRHMPCIVIKYDNQDVPKNTPLMPITISSQPQFASHLDPNSALIFLMFVTFRDISVISYLKSSYFKFKPIPSNKQELTSIKIYIVEGDEGDGKSKSKEILGSVVKFDDEFVVKLSESIFQDEVKKYRLKWNGNVIGSGTRLYFPPLKAGDMSSDFWVLEFDPIPKYIQHLQYVHRTNRTVNMCCIGHPHGGPKMVTFGQELGESIEGYDNQGREVKYLKHSCKTCPGSSGSPVLTLYKGMNVTYSCFHFKGEKVEMVLSNGELIENINTTWCPYKTIKRIS